MTTHWHSNLTDWYDISESEREADGLHGTRCPNCHGPLRPVCFLRADESAHSSGYTCSKCKRSFTEKEVDHG
jgi:DNA-directed RNA polymerase subunit RPC12/RpoP